MESICIDWATQTINNDRFDNAGQLRDVGLHLNTTRSTKTTDIGKYRLVVIDF